MTPGLLISAPASGAGKTMVTLGLLAAWRAQGLAVQPFKNGPDYIDPGFHRAAAGRLSLNLDSWAMDRGRIAALARRGEDADLIVAEGSMGLFDGVAQPGETGVGASADLAMTMGWPVVLVLDVSGQAQTAAAQARGMALFRRGVQVAGVILNRVASPRHERLLRAGMEEAGLSVLGALPRHKAIALPERHLGLVQAQELPGLQRILSDLAGLISDHCDLPAIRAAARAGAAPAVAAPVPIPAPGARVALARDAAFSFVYPHVLADWRAQGVTILPFSPLADEGPDPSASICWLPGGYPELHAARLADCGRFRAALAEFARSRPVHGECGGYMVLGQALTTADGIRHKMAGLLGLETSFATRRMNLGYRRARLLHPLPGLKPGATLCGHEFHYATVTAQPDMALAEVTDADGTRLPGTGSLRRQTGGGCTSGTFFHLIAPATTREAG